MSTFKFLCYCKSIGKCCVKRVQATSIKEAREKLVRGEYKICL